MPFSIYTYIQLLESISHDLGWQFGLLITLCDSDSISSVELRNDAIDADSTSKFGADAHFGLSKRPINVGSVPNLLQFSD